MHRILHMKKQNGGGGNGAFNLPLNLSKKNDIIQRKNKIKSP